MKFDTMAVGPAVVDRRSYRSYGNENWEFDDNGLMRLRLASINDAPIREADRRLRWPQGSHPSDHPGFTELGL